MVYAKWCPVTLGRLHFCNIETQKFCAAGMKVVIFWVGFGAENRAVLDGVFGRIDGYFFC